MDPLDNTTMGWWIPGSGQTFNGPDGIRTALEMLHQPVFVSDHQKTFLAAAGGSAVIGDKSSRPENGIPMKAFAPALTMSSLGDREFKNRHNLTYAYIAGAMANGITSVPMVEAMANAGMLSFFGAGGLTPGQVEDAIVSLKQKLGDKSFGFNLIHSPGDPDLEMAIVNGYLRHGIRRVSAAAFMRMTLPLVYYRVKGIYQDANGKIQVPNQVIAKVSRVEVARHFFSPPPDKIVNALLDQGLISQNEADLSRRIPMAQDLTAEADSGGHTDNRPALALLPTMLSLRDELSRAQDYGIRLCVGLGGGIATPESTAAAFQMGAAYVLTGSINQSCIEAGTSETVKSLLAQAEQADVAMAPAADMFEMGGRVQVLKRGTMFPVRAEKLFRFYRQYDAFHQIPLRSRQEIEEKILQATFEESWEKTREFFRTANPGELERATNNPKHQMALVFRSYLGLSSKWPLTGDPTRKIDYQIWCGPAMGAFNQWAKGSVLEKPAGRRVVDIALNLLYGACFVIRAGWLSSQGVNLPPGTAAFRPLEIDRLMERIKTDRT